MTRGVGLASRATMTTNTLALDHEIQDVRIWDVWDGNTPSTRLEHGSLTQST